MSTPRADQTMSAGGPKTTAFARVIGSVARELLGEPTKANQREQRYGTHGSLAVDLTKGTYYNHETAKGGGVIDLVQEHTGSDRRGAVDWLETHGHLPKAAPKIGKPRQVATYGYTDEAGTLLFQVLRFEPKSFRQRAPDGDGWIWKMTGVRRVLYRLPAVVAAVAAGRTVYIVEGEKAADALSKLGVVATCSPGGANKWRTDYGKSLAGADVVILPDNDEPGRQHATAVAQSLQGVAGTVRTLSLPSLQPKADAFDWITAGGSAAELARLAAAAASDEEPSAVDTINSRNEPHANGHDDSKPNGTLPPQPANAQPIPEPVAQPRSKKRPQNALALVNFMAGDPNWRGAARVNLFTETLQVCDQFPPLEPPTGAFRPLREPADLLEAMLHFQGAGFPRANKSLVWDALSVMAHRNAFHPVRDYLNGLRWDGQKRLGRLFQDYFNGEIPNDAAAADRTVAYLEHISLCFMVSAVARIRQPGCKVDHLPVLVGPQGYHKSQAIRDLCADPAWFSDDLSTDLMERDTKESLTGKWIVELAEMPHAKKEVERVKAFFSRQTDRYRRAYDRTTNDWPRQNIFMASSNDFEVIDYTGARRNWPFDINAPIDVQKIITDRERLWAEAVVLYESGYAWWLAPNIEKIAGEQQGRFQEEDIWTSELASWVKNRPAFTLADAMTGALGFLDPKQILKTEQNRAANCLKGLGFRRRQSRSGDTTRWLWIKEKPRSP